MSFRLRTLMLVMAIGPPVLAGAVLMPRIALMALLDLVVFAAFAAGLVGLWIRWPTFMDRLFKWLSLRGTLRVGPKTLPSMRHILEERAS